MAMVRRTVGFTILELLIVMAVLGVVTTTGAFVAKTQIMKAQDSRRKQDLNLIQKALEHYYSDFGTYPTEGLVEDCGGIGLNPYLSKIPCDPVLKIAYEYVLLALGKAYALYTRLAWTKDPAISGVGCQSGCGPGNAYNYGVSSSGVSVGAGAAEEGVQAECGGPGNWFCFANVCSECCPGNNYRCNGAGTKCLLDATCQ